MKRIFFYFVPLRIFVILALFSNAAQAEDLQAKFNQAANLANKGTQASDIQKKICESEVQNMREQGAGAAADKKQQEECDGYDGNGTGQQQAQQGNQGGVPKVQDEGSADALSASSTPKQSTAATDPNSETVWTSEGPVELNNPNGNSTATNNAGNTPSVDPNSEIAWTSEGPVELNNPNGQQAYNQPVGPEEIPFSQSYMPENPPASGQNYIITDATGAAKNMTAWTDPSTGKVYTMPTDQVAGYTKAYNAAKAAQYPNGMPAGSTVKMSSNEIAASGLNTVNNGVATAWPTSTPATTTPVQNVAQGVRTPTYSSLQSGDWVEGNMVLRACTSCPYRRQQVGSVSGNQVTYF